MQRTSGLKLINGKLHAVRYIFEDGLTIKELEEAGIVRLKSGISSRETPKQYKTETIRTDSTGKKFLLWDDNFLDQNLSFDQAADIIKKMDSIFKQLMMDQGYHSRTIHNDRSIGTEFYEENHKDSLVEIIERNWDKAYRIAYEYVTKTELPNGIEILPFEPRPKQDVLFIDPLVNYYKTGDKATAQSHGGTGKTKMSFRVSEIVCKDVLKKPWKTLMFSDTRANTVQLAAEFAKFYKGQTGKRLLNIYLIGAVDKKDVKVLESWVNVHRVSNVAQVSKCLIDSFNTKNPCAFFVVNKSAEKFLKLAAKLKINFKNWFTALDEIQQYANESDQPKVVTSSECAVVNPKFENLFGKKLGLSATHIVRDINVCDDMSAVFNDDLDKFGPRVVNVDEITARSLGWISEKEGVIIPLPSTPEFLTSLQEKRPIEVTLDEESILIHPQYFVAVEGLVKYILTQNKTHILLLSTYIKDIQLLAELFKLLQEKGKIDSEYQIIEGYSKKGNSCVNEFNKAKKAIMIATRWIGVGQDTYKCDCTFPLYNPTSEAFARQFSMRGDRVYEDKVSLLAFVALERAVYVDSIQSFRDSIWFKCLENISNGKIPNIVSEAEFREANSNIVIGSNRNPRDGSNVGNVTVVRSSNNDPILFENWEELANHITARTFTDEFGNSKFSEIVSFHLWSYSNPTQKMFDRAVSIAKTFNSLHEFNGWDARKNGETVDYEAHNAFKFLRKTNPELLTQATEHMVDGPWAPDEIFKNDSIEYKSKFDELGFKYWDEVKGFFFEKYGEEKGMQMYHSFHRNFCKRTTGVDNYTKRPSLIIKELTTGFRGNVFQIKEKFGMAPNSARKWATYDKPIPANPSAPQYNGLHFQLDPECSAYINQRYKDSIVEVKNKTDKYKRYKELYSGITGTTRELAEKFNCTCVTVANSAKNKRPLRGRKVEFANINSNRKPTPSDKINRRTYVGVSFNQIDNDGNIVKKWDSIKECHEATGISKGGISNVLNGSAKSSGGFRFERIKK